MTTENQAEAPARERLPGEKLILPGTTIGGEVGTFYVDFVLWNREMTDSRTLNALVDTGATYTQVPASVLDELGVERRQTRTFSMADGSTQRLSVGWAEIELGGDQAVVHIIFGEENGKILLGAHALEAFGLAADAKNGRLIPADLTR